ncbi:hypothetical protein BDZ97DRAFT_1647274 [Flammula alnicola]|nr:hypothetical protein BDZ97DRAFT_1647274 [Flammula alnicola]
MTGTKPGESSTQPSTEHEPAQLSSDSVPSDASSNVQPKGHEPEVQPQLVAESAPQASPAQPEDRGQLLARARSFLTSPQVQYQDIFAKRAFLVEKGLNEAEIESLLRNVPVQPPNIPPRTYPQPPPSHLPVLLLGLARLFSWLAGGSAALLLIYYRFFLPRIAQTSLARHSLKAHHLTLLRQLTTSLSSLKESQSESFSVLPRSDPFKEPQKYSECKSVVEIIKVSREGEKEPDFSELPVISILRCGIKDLKKKPTTEELFRFLEGQIPWLLTEEGLQFEQKLWETLSTCLLFGKVTASSSSLNDTSEPHPPTQWEYIPPTPVSPPPLVESLDKLSQELPKDVKTRKSPFQYTLQSMSDFTGYLSTQVYLPYRPPPVGMGLSSNNGQNTLEEELRREIRALKGLVLNRRSFMPSIPRPGLTSVPNRTTA